MRDRSPVEQMSGLVLYRNQGITRSMSLTENGSCINITDAGHTFCGEPAPVTVCSRTKNRSSLLYCFDPCAERTQEVLEELTCGLMDQFAVVIVQGCGIGHISFRLLHDRHIQEYKRLP